MKNVGHDELGNALTAVFKAMKPDSQTQMVLGTSIHAMSLYIRAKQTLNSEQGFESALPNKTFNRDLNYV